MELRPILLSLKHNKFMSLIIVVQIAFTMAVLSNSVFLSVTTLKEWNLPSGLPQDDIIRVTPRFYDPNQDVPAAVIADLQRVREMPGVEAVAPTNAVPFTAENVSKVYLSSDQEAEGFDTVVFDSDENLMQVLQLSLLEGRAFEFGDVIRETGSTNSEVMISQDMANELFPGQTAVGQTIWLQQGAEPVKIVGVYSNFMNGERLNYYGKSYHTIIRPRSIWQFEGEPHYLIRMQPGIAESSLEDVASLFYLQQGRYLFIYERLKRTQKRMYDGRGSRALTFLVISAVLVLITAFGVAGLTSFQTNQKRKQIGTRRALGGRKSKIMQYFFTETSVLTLVGLFLGTVVTIAMTFELSMIEQENILNLGIMFLIALLLWLVNLVAVFLPVKRAAGVAPAIVTRSA